jgi:hypothetical protein
MRFWWISRDWFTLVARLFGRPNKEHHRQSSFLRRRDWQQTTYYRSSGRARRYLCTRFILHFSWKINISNIADSGWEAWDINLHAYFAKHSRGELPVLSCWVLLPSPRAVFSLSSYIYALRPILRSQARPPPPTLSHRSRFISFSSFLLFSLLNADGLVCPIL